MTELRYKPGMLVDFHPCTDIWMRGGTSGIIQTVGNKYMRVAVLVGGVECGKTVRVHLYCKNVKPHNEDWSDE